MKKISLLISVLIGLIFFSHPGFGKQLPLWELGLGGSVLSLPDYRGSDETRTYILPFPYVIYRGEFLKVDREQISGLLFKSKSLQLDMSFYGSVPVDSTKNKARQGMPDLDPTFEVGPELQVILAENKESEYKVTLSFPIRAVMSTNFTSVRSAGFNFTPRFNVDFFNIAKKGWESGLSIGPIFGDKIYHDYYYQVEPAYARPDRPAYSSQAGYSGLQCALYLGKKFKKIVGGVFVRAEDLHGTAFSDSPLLKNTFSVMGGLYFSWVFMESKTLVEADK